MIQLLVDNIDQLDLALDQLAIRDRNFDRFALMLIDNAVELAVHGFIQEKSTLLWMTSASFEKDVSIAEKALGKNFDNKVKGAKALGIIDNSACESILNLHSFRNTSYHKGFRHEGILHSLSIFYFKKACELHAIFEPDLWYNNYDTIISYRARKYLDEYSHNNVKNNHIYAFNRLNKAASSLEYDLIGDLSDDMKYVIESADNDIDFLSCGFFEERSRDSVVVDAQARVFCLTDESKNFAIKNGCPSQIIGNGYEFIRWISSNYKFKETKDPIRRWLERHSSLAGEKNEDIALKKYCDFMRQTEGVRSAIMEDAVILKSYIDSEEERAMSMFHPEWKW